MKLWVLSDLHDDHGGALPDPPDGADVAVIAGDVLNDGWLIEIARKLPVVFVAGNHEFYRFSFHERMDQLKALEGVRTLNNDAVQIGQVRFIGATLWTDYNRNPLALDAAWRGMNDHRLIKWHKNPWERFSPKHAVMLHAASRKFIERVLAQPHFGPTVVVTHHAPHHLSVHRRYDGDLLNHAYYSDLGQVIETGHPTLWVHGHVHSCFDYWVGETRVLCNPRGYPGENRQFNDALLVEI
ncbi:metallophosphoesterase [Bosea sp. UC22_33]|uniref:metallophosphoesterase n=1 Tax=Bosea sp. UC22_33 TaxID=3350165 RepID=UPI0036732D23